MAVSNFIGGTTAAAQSLTLTVGGTWATSNTIRTTLTAEDGSTTQSVTSSATGSDKETQVVDVHISDLQASTQSLFSAVTWVKNGTVKVQGTAKIAGVPFSNTGGLMAGTVPAGSGTYGTLATVTTQAGPNDFGTAGNFTLANESAASLPGTGDTVKILPHPSDVDNAGNPVSYDILYGLAIGTNLNRLRIPKSYRGSIGDSANGYYLQLDCTSSTGKTVINSRCPALWLKGTHTEINVVNTENTVNALRLSGGTITDLRILGSDIAGNIKIADSTVVTNAYIFGVGSVRITFGTSGTVISVLKMDSGEVETDHGITALTIAGGVLTHQGGVITDADNYGGYVFYNSTDDNDLWNNHSGTLDLSQNMSDSVTIGGGNDGADGVFIWSGLINDRGGLANVTYGDGSPAGITKYGGDVSSDSATIIVAT